MLTCSNTSTLAHGWWGMTYGFDLYVFMFGVTLDELLVEHIGIKKKKKKRYPLINFSLSNWASCLKAVSVHVKR
jgi:hypothetical protein